MSKQLNLRALFVITSALLFSPLAKAQTTKTVTVPGNQPWTDTGILLSAGETVSITASGSIYVGGRIPAWVNATPNGQPLPQCGIGKQTPFPAPNAACFSLIGEITQTGTPFEVGSNVTFSAAVPGEFYLGVNDNGFPNNTGSWTAIINVYPQSTLVLGCQPLTGPPTETVFYSATCTAYGGTAPYNWSIGNGSLPSGLSLSAPTGQSVTISGTPSTSGQYSYTVEVTDSSIPNQNGSLTYSGTTSSLVLSCETNTGTPIPNYPNTGPAQLGVFYSATCMASGGMTPYNWSIVDGALPTGVSLSGTTGNSVTISGSPTGSGYVAYSYAVQVADSSNPVQISSEMYDGLAGNLSLTCNPTTGPVQVGVFYSTTCMAANGTPLSLPYTFAIVNGSLPGGLTSTTTSTQITISGTPTTAAPYSYTVQLTDNNNPTETVVQNYNGTILPATAIDLAASPSTLSFNYTVGSAQPASQTLAISSPGAALAFTAAASTTNGGSWLSVTPTSGTTPANLMVSVNTTGLAAGTYSGTVSVTAAGAANSPLTVMVTLTVISNSTVYTVTVLPNQLWTDTKISLVAGQTVNITASGSINVGGRIPGWVNATPNGQPLPQCAIGKQSPFPAPNAACWSLIGEITQTGTPFEVGSSVTFSAAASGEFYLGVNDNGFSNNTGSWTAIITVYQPSALVLGCQPLTGPPTETVAYSATCTAYGGTAPYNWSIGNGSLPAGLSLSAATGQSVTIGGAPAVSGPYSYTVQLTDSSSPIQNGSLTYSGTTGTLILTCSTTTGTPIPGYPNTGPPQLGVPYSATCTASNGVGQYNWSIVDGALPAGVSLSGTTGASVTISGSPTGSGYVGYSYAVQVADSGSPAQISSEVYDGLAGNLSLTCTPTTGPVQVGVAYSATCTAANGTPLSLPYTFAIVNGTLPAGLTSATTSTQITISGTPASTTAGQAYSYTVQLTDNNNPTETVVQNYSGTIAGMTLPSLAPSPSSLSFTYTVGGAQPVSQTLAISSSGAALAFTAAASITTGGNWLSVAPTSGTTPASLMVSVNTTGLAAGSYSGMVSVTAAGAGNSPLVVPVTFTVFAQPNLVAMPTSLSFSYQQNGTAPAAQPLSLSSSSNSTPALPFTVTVGTTNGGNWLAVTPTSGTTPATLMVSANSGLTAGSYTGTITVTAGGAGNSPLMVQVTLTVASPPNLTATPASLSFSYQQNGTQPAAQTFGLSSSGAALSFTAAASTASGGNWLSVTPTGGTTPATETVSVNTTGLAAGSYSGMVTVTATGAGNSPRIVMVTLTVTTLPNLVAAPTSLSFTSQQNGSQPAQTLALSSSSSAVSALSFTAAASTSSGGNWLSVTATSGTTPANLMVSVNTTGLAPNTYSGMITVTSAGAGNSGLAVPVTLTILPNLIPAPTSLSFSYQQGGTEPPSQTLSIASSGAALTFSASSSGGAWLSVSPISGTAPANLVVSVTAAGLAGGSYSGTVTVTAAAGNSPLTVPVTLTVTALPNLVATSASLSFTYQQGGAQPASQPLGISSSSSSVAALSFTTTASTTSGGAWLMVTPGGGTTPATLTVSVNNGLAAGSYTGTVMVASTGAGNSPLIVPVNLTVTPQAVLVVSPLALTFPSYQIGGTPPQSQTVSVTSNPSSSVLSFTVVPGAGCSWLAMTASSSVTPATITAAVNTTGLTAQTYNCTFSVTGGGGKPAQVTATLSVTPALFSVAPPSLSFAYQATSTTTAAPTPLPISVTSSQSFTATASTTSGGQWLSVNPSGGSGSATATSLSVSVNPTGLAVGTYNGAVAIGSGGNKQSVFVTLTVSGPTLAGSGLQAFAYTAGGTAPAAQSLTITSSNSQAVSFTASSACPWLAALPSTTLQTGTPFSLTPNVSVLGGYSPGTYNCSVSIASAQASNSLSVSLTLTVSPAHLTVSPATVSFNVEQGSSTPLLSTVAINAPAPVSFTAAVTGCPSASWLSVTPATAMGTTPASLSLQANPAGLTASPAACQVTVTPSQGQSLTIDASLTISKLPTLIVAPSGLSFRFTQGTATSPQFSQVVSVLASGNAQITFTPATSGLLTSSAGSQNALHVASGPGTGNITVSVDSSLTAGFYTGTVTVSSTQTNPGMQTVTVAVLVDPPPQEAPVLTVAPGSLTFSFTSTGSGNAGSQLLSVANQGGGAPSVTALASTDSGGNWLSVPTGASPAITGSSPASIAVSANPAAVIPNASGQVAGTYTGKVVLTAPDLAPLTIPVTMTVTASPIIQLSRTGLSYTVVLGGNETPPQSVYILNPGSGTLNWSAQAGQNGCGDWLTFPGGSMGSVSAGTPAQLLVALNGTAVQSQAAGTYYCSVQVTAPGAANSPETVTVVLNVLAAGSYLSPFVQPSGYVFTGTAGSPVPPAEITIVSPTLQPVTYSSAAVTSDGGSWCTVSPDHGPVTGDVPIDIAADYTKLNAGTAYTCTVQLSFSDGSLQTVNLLAIVTPAAADPGNVSSPQGQPRTSGQSGTNCSPGAPVFVNPGAGFNAAAFQPSEVDIQIQDSCGNPIDTQNVFLFSTYSGGNNDPAGDFVGPTQTAPGLYKYQWTPTNSPQNISQSAVTLTAAYIPSVSHITPPASDLAGFVSLAPSPTRTVEVASAASYTTQMAVGAIIAIFGDNLADGEQQASQVPLPTELKQTTVLVDNQKVPLFYASSGQINAQIPYNLSTNSPHQLVVVRDDTQSLPQSFTLADAQPAIFTTNSEGFGQGAILGPDNVTLADSNNPVGVGDVAVIYCAGLGPVTPTVIAGSPAGVLTHLTAPLTVTIGNVAATNIAYAGLSPSYVGLYQVNVTVPDGVQSGQVPVVITVGNLQSQPGVTMAVK